MPMKHLQSLARHTGVYTIPSDIYLFIYTNILVSLVAKWEFSFGRLHVL